MYRRLFLAITLVIATLPQMAPAQSGTESTPNEVVLALAGGKTVLVDFHGARCKVCGAQAEVIAALNGNSPGLSEAVTFMSVDYDAHAGSDLAKALTVDAPGTLIVLRGGREFGRLVGETDTQAIRALVQTAYTVANE